MKLPELNRLTRNLCLPVALFLIVVRSIDAQVNAISYPQALPKDVVTDIQYLVQASTGQRWAAQQDKPSNAGLILAIKMDGDYKTGESCLVTSDGSSYAKFESPTIYGLIYGVYKYFRDMGFKFYLPDSLYTIIPKLESIFKKKST